MHTIVRVTFPYIFENILIFRELADQARHDAIHDPYKVVNKVMTYAFAIIIAVFTIALLFFIRLIPSDRE